MRNCRGVFSRFRNRATVFLYGSGVGGIALSSPHSDNTTFFISLSAGWFHDWSVFLVIHWLCYSLWLFHLHSEVKIQPFSPVFPLAESIAKAFCRLFLWSFKEKSINHFLGHSLFNSSLMDFMIGAFYWLFLWSFKKYGINRFPWHSLQHWNTRSPTWKRTQESLWTGIR